MNDDTSHDANDEQQTPPPLHVVNKGASPRTKPTIIIVCAVAAAIVFFGGILGAVLFPAVANAILRANMIGMANHAKDIYAVIGRTITGCDGLIFEPLWPKSGKPMEYDSKDMDILDMTFANSSDYFTVLYDGEKYGMPEWTPYSEFDYSKCAGAGVWSKTGGGRLTAQNNAWTIAANITGDMPDIIPFIVSRNVDPSSLIPREGNLSEQFLRPSKRFTTPFGNKAFVVISKGGAIYQGTWQYARLDRLYQDANGKELQAIRDAFEKIKYLEP